MPTYPLIKPNTSVPNPLTPLSQVTPSVPSGASNPFAGIGNFLGGLFKGGGTSSYAPPAPVTSPLAGAFSNYKAPITLPGFNLSGMNGSTPAQTTPTTPVVPPKPQGTPNKGIVASTPIKPSTLSTNSKANNNSTPVTPQILSSTTPASPAPFIADAPNGTQATVPTTNPATGAPNNNTGTPATPPSYSDIIQQLINSGQMSPDELAANTALNNYDTAYQTGLNNITEKPIPLEFQQGQSAALTRNASIEENTLANRLAVAQANRKIKTDALGTAAGLAAPIQAPYSNRVISPTTGASIGGDGSGTLPAEAQTAVNSYAEQVKNGSMTRADAESRLSAYGIAGTNALNTALGSNFNTNASNASAATTATGQQLQTAATATNQALTTLSTLYDSLPGTSKTGIPGVNGLANNIEGFLGSSQLTAYKQTLADARAQLQGVLTASGAATPTGAESAALTYLPDNMSPSQLKAAIANVQQLIQQKVNSFTQSGNQGTNFGTSTTSGGSIYDF